MTRKRSTYRPRHTSPPMLINRGIRNTDIESAERMAVEAFSGGWAGPEHFDYLADMRDCMMIAAAHKHDQEALGMCRAILVVMDNVRTRHQQTQRFGCSGDELHLLRIFCDTYRDFWLRQPVWLYDAAVTALDKLRMSGAMSVNIEPAHH